MKKDMVWQRQAVYDEAVIGRPVMRRLSMDPTRGTLMHVWGRWMEVEVKVEVEVERLQTVCLSVCRYLLDMTRQALTDPVQGMAWPGLAWSAVLCFRRLAILVRCVRSTLASR